MKSLAFVLVFIFSFFLFIACGKDNPARNSGGDQQNVRRDAAPPSFVDGFPPPGGRGGVSPPSDVNAGVFEMLRDEFLKALGEYPERTSASAPMGESGRVTDLAYDSGTNLLTWTYVNLGDYNLSGDVSIADVAEVARYYLADATDGEGDDPYEAWVDGSGDGEVNIADVAPLAQNYLNEVAEYVILTSASAEGEYTEIARVDFADAKTPSTSHQEGAHSWAPRGFSREDGGQEWPPSSYGEPDKTPSQTGANFPKIFEVALPAGALAYIAVEPVDSSDNAGERSNAVGISGEGEAPDVGSVFPTVGDAGVIVQFTASVTGAAPFEYAWNFGGGAVPGTTIDPSPTVTLAGVGTPTLFDASLTVTNEFGMDTFEFGLGVSPAGTAPTVGPVSPTSGESTVEVTFNADVLGSPPLDFAWDFGGGAEPNTSSEVSPTVTLGDEGEYPASLTVENPYGEDVFNFTLAISAYNEPPVASAQATPLIGDSPLAVTLLSSGSNDPDGDIVLYEWDFETDGEYDYSSPTPAMIEHEYPGEEGQGDPSGDGYTGVLYNATLRVTDDGGKTATAQTDEILSNDAHKYWTFEYVDGGTEAGYQAGRHLSTLIDPADDRPCIVYVAQNPLHAYWWKTIKVAWRNAPGDWEFDEYDLPWGGSEKRMVDMLSNAEFLPDGTLVVAVQEFLKSPPESDLYFLWRYPDGTWVRELIDDEGVETGTLPTLAVNEPGDPAIVYIYATNDSYIYVGEQRYAIYNGSSWAIEAIDNPVGEYRIQFIGDTAYKLEGYETLQVFEKQGSIWEAELVAIADEYFDDRAFLQYGGGFHIIVEEGGVDEVLFFSNSTGFWQRELIFKDSENGNLMPGNPSIAADEDYIYAAYLYNAQPTFAYRTDGNWTLEQLRYDVDSSLGKSTLAVAEDGEVFFSYYSLRDQDVRFGVREPVG